MNVKKIRLFALPAIVVGVAMSQSAIAADMRVCLKNCYKSEVKTEQNAKDCLQVCKGLKGEAAVVGRCRAESRIIEFAADRIHENPGLLLEPKRDQLNAKVAELVALKAKCDNKESLDKVREAHQDVVDHIAEEAASRDEGKKKAEEARQQYLKEQKGETVEKDAEEAAAREEGKKKAEEARQQYLKEQKGETVEKDAEEAAAREEGKKKAEEARQQYLKEQQ